MNFSTFIHSSRGRFLFSLTVVVFSVLGVIGIQASIHVGHYHKLRRTELQRIVDVAEASVREDLNLYHAGDVTFDDARQRVLERMHSLSYQEGGHPNFFFVGTYERTPLILPGEAPNAGLHSVDIYRGHTSEVLAEMVAAARSREQRGFVSYPVEMNDDTSHTKIAYIRGIPDLNIFIGTSLYTTDINEAVHAVVLRSSLVGAVFVLLALGAMVLALQPLTRISRQLSDVFTRIAKDPNESLKSVYPEQLQWKEGQIIFEGLQRMLSSLRTARFRQEESEDRFRRLFSESRDAIILTTGLKVLECNKRAESFLSMRRDILVGSDIRQLLENSPSLTSDQVRELLEKAIDGETVEVSLQLPSVDDTDSGRFVDMTMHPQYLDMEFGFQIVMHDITAIRQTEQMLQKVNENLYRTLYSIGDGIIATDADGRITRMNKVAEELTGWEQDLAIGSHFNQVVHLRESNGGQALCSLDTVLRSGSNTRSEMREVFSRTNQRRTVSENGAPIRNADDELTGGVVVFRDITAQLQLQREFRENQRILSLVLDHAPVGVGAFTRGGAFIYANPMLCEMVDYSAIELRRMRFSPLVHPDDLSRHAREFRRLMQGFGRESFEVRYIRRNGEERHAVLRGGGVKSDSQSRPDFVVVIVQDVTEIKRAAQESLKKEQLLIQAEKLAALGELSAGMAHEINQPLTGISMAADNLQFLASGQIPGKAISGAYVADKTAHIHDYVDRIRSIIEHVRTFSREQLHEQQEPFDPLDAVRNALSLVTSQYRGHGIDVQLDLNAVLPAAGNMYRLEQVVLNLLTNAKDAVLEQRSKSASGFRPLITVGCYPSKVGCSIRISDNGTGISPDQLQQIFHPFYTTKSVDKGTGLGLSVAYGIIQEMGGDIIFTSELEHGTTAEIRLQAVEEDA